jgi:DNA-binding CsgD family transcriptional regulator
MESFEDRLQRGLLGETHRGPSFASCGISALAASGGVDADVIHYGEFDFGRKVLRNTANHPYAESLEWASLYVDLTFQDDAIQLWRDVSSRLGEANCVDGMGLRAQWENTELHSEFCRRLHMHYLALVPVRVVDGTLCVFGLTREKGRFCVEDIQILTARAKQLRNAASVSDLLQVLQAGVRCAVDPLGYRVEIEKIALLPSGIVTESTSRAFRWLIEFFGPPPARGFGIPHTLHSTVRSHIKSSFSVPFQSIVKHDGQQLDVQVLADDDRLCLILRRRIPLRASELTERLNLTPVLAQVLVTMLRHPNKTEKELAQLIGKPYSTLRKNVHDIRQKLGVKKRSEFAGAVSQRLTSIGFGLD